MVDADLAAVVSRLAAGPQQVEVGKSEPMVFVVIREKRQGRVFIDHLGFEDVAIPRDHLVEAPCHIDHVCELDRLGHIFTPSLQLPSNATENYGRALDRAATMQALLSHDGEFSRVFSRGVMDPSSLTPAQRTQLTWSLYEAFGAFEFMFHASKSDAIPEEVWKRWSEATAWWLTFPGVRAWWNARPVPFTESFTAFVDSLIRENPEFLRT